MRVIIIIGYGTIRFEGEIDLTGMNLDDAVQIRRKEVAVYPDDMFKPPIGTGLNRLVRKEVAVYPDDLFKPPIGTGLNRLELNFVAAVLKIDFKLKKIDTVWL